MRLSISFTYLLAYLDSAAKRRVHTGGFNLLFWRHNFFFPFLQFTLHYIHSHANIDRLQRVQNVLARVVAQAPPTISSVYIWCDLRWLPVNHCISYKLSLLTWKVLHTVEPSYLSELISPYVPAQTLRSSNTCLLAIPTGVTSLFSSRSFSTSAPSTWNSLPVHIHSLENLSTFKRQLKSHFFQSAFTV